MTLSECLLIIGAGIGAGTINTIVGSGTLVTFPTLLAVGLPPVSASMTNSLGLIPGNIMGAVGYRREAAQQSHRIRMLLPWTLTGAVTGACALLFLPPSVFEQVVPILILLAMVLVLAQPAIKRRLAKASSAAPDASRSISARRTRATAAMLLAALFCAVYGGYFAAAQGVLFLGLFGLLVPGDLQSVNGMKNVLVAVVNAVAALVYTTFGFENIDWVAAGLVALGAAIGGWLGAHLGRRLSTSVLRGVIVVLGCVALWHLLR